MTITGVRLERFTAFEELDFAASPGINVLVGANGTGKTHLMKVAYAACDVSKTGVGFADKLTRLFMPSGGRPGRLVKRRTGRSRCLVEVRSDVWKLGVSFSNQTTAPAGATVTGAKEWAAHPVESVFVPVKEMLANAPGFRSLYAQREIHFEEITPTFLTAHIGPGCAVRREPLARNYCVVCKRRSPAKSP